MARDISLWKINYMFNIYIIYIYILFAWIGNGFPQLRFFFNQFIHCMFFSTNFRLFSRKYLGQNCTPFTGTFPPMSASKFLSSNILLFRNTVVCVHGLQSWYPQHFCRNPITNYMADSCQDSMPSCVLEQGTECGTVCYF